MKRNVALLASMVAAVLLAGMVATVTVERPARAAFPGINGKIAFLSDRDGNNEIYTISLTRGKWGDPKRLTFSPKSDKTPSWSPGGKKITFERGDRLYKMNPDGSNLREIPNTVHSNYEIGRYGSYGGNPAYSPDGRKIIFDKGKNIYTINVGGTNLTRITSVPAGASPTFVHPVWSPVGNKIAFSWLLGDGDVVRELHVMPLSDLRNKQNLDDTSKLSPDGARVYRPDWSPDGSQVVYECYDPCGGSGGAYSPNA